MAHTSSVYAILSLAIGPSANPPKVLGSKPGRVDPAFERIFSAARSGYLAIVSVARNEDSPQRRHHRVASEALR